MQQPTFEELLEAGVHLGHLKRKWNPLMSQYIFGVRNGIHIIDLHKTLVKLEEASKAIQQIAKSGKKILFVATKKQAKEILEEKLAGLGMPYVTERWSGGMLTNFATIRRSIKKMHTLEKMFKDGTADTLSKRERLQLQRQKEKMERLFGSIVDMTKIPSAIFVIDLKKEATAIKEAKKLGIPVFGMVDTNVNPGEVDFPIPANDDVVASIDKIVSIVTQAIALGLEEKKANTSKDEAEENAENVNEATHTEAKPAPRTRKKRTESRPEQN